MPEPSPVFIAIGSICHESPVKGGGNEGLSLAEQGINLQSWAVLWRSIVLSTLGKTMYSYCRHLRTLDLRDLGYLLDDDKFRGKISKTFFSGAMARFHFVLPNTGKARAPRLDTNKIIRDVGDQIIQHAPLLEGLSGPATSDVLSSALSGWIPRLVHLRRFEVWDGKVFADEKTRDLLHTHCPKLSSLAMYMNSSPDPDHTLAALVGGMQENQLSYFENLGNCGISTETLTALNRHRSSLKVLKLAVPEDGVFALGLLHGCTALQELAISSESTTNFEESQNDIYREIIEWLKACGGLKKLTFHGVFSAPDFTLPILQNKDVVLESLHIGATKEDTTYRVVDHLAFHKAIMAQPNLRALHLTGDPDQVSRDDIETLIDALCSLTAMQELKLVRISDYFSDEHIKLLLRHTTALRELYIGGFGISDAVLAEVANLRDLRTITFSGITSFTCSGILELIEKLGDGNMGLVFAVDAADPDAGLTPEEQDLLRDVMQTKLDGRFEYQLLRDPNAPVFDSDESD